MKTAILRTLILSASTLTLFSITPGDAQDKGGPAASRIAPPLEQRTYIKNMKVLGHYFPGVDRGGKMQMMAIGKRRYLIHSYQEESGQILDITNPLKPEVVADHTWPGGYQIQVAFQESSGKWLAIVPMAHAWESMPKGAMLGIYDISNPRKPHLLSHLPDVTHRNYYDGGRYAYLSNSPHGLGEDHEISSDTLTPKVRSNGLKILDLSDPAEPKTVSITHFPGQDPSEIEARKTWRSYGNKRAAGTMHGAAYVPVRVEDGGKHAYGPWGALGIIIHDVSDPKNPHLVSQWLPEDAVFDGLAFHTVDITRLDRDFVIGSPEGLAPQCQWPWQDTYIVDVSDLAKPQQLSKLPVPQPPEGAPYKNFCEGRFGRFGPHNPPHLKAPGKPAPNFTCYAFFAAGLQCYDIRDPRNPKISAYYLPKQGDASQAWEPHPDLRGKAIRTADNVFIEWDRNLLWLATDSGLYLLSTPQLGEPILDALPVKEWVLPSINRGWDRAAVPL